MGNGGIGTVRKKTTGEIFTVIGWLKDGCVYASKEGFLEVMSDWEYIIISKNGRRYIDE